ncbi:MAG: hypothetical protein N2109_07800 [Fimbriimonadales bacterium]|nr:hypothetical protein [Fimbriimonadales bacterium]
MPKLLLWVAFAALALFVIVLGAERYLASRAVWAQRVMTPNADVEALFGGEPTPIGSPQQYVVFDGKAFLSERNESGVLQLDERYLQRTGTYPLQLKTVEFVGSLARWGTALLAVLAFGVRWLMLRKEAGAAA